MHTISARTILLGIAAAMMAALLVEVVYPGQGIAVGAGAGAGQAAWLLQAAGRPAPLVLVISVAVMAALVGLALVSVWAAGALVLACSMGLLGVLVPSMRAVAIMRP